MKAQRAVIFAAIFAANGAFLVHAAVTVRHRDSISFAADVEKHLAAHGSTRYYLSPKVADLVTSTKPANVTTDTTAAEWCILFTDEVPETDWSKWLCNHLGEYHLVSGPIAVNFDYYASWVGPPMMVELKMSQARQMHLLAGL